MKNRSCSHMLHAQVALRVHGIKHVCSNSGVLFWLSLFCSVVICRSFAASFPVYETDDRKQYYEMPKADSTYLRELASGTCLITKKSYLAGTSGGKLKLKMYGKLWEKVVTDTVPKACDDLRFANEPVVNYASSASLVGDSLILTARHTATRYPLDSLVCIFSYFNRKSGDIQLKKDRVYETTTVGNLVKTSVRYSEPYILIDTADVRYFQSQPVRYSDSTVTTQDWAVLRLSKAAPLHAKRLCVYKNYNVKNQIASYDYELFTMGFPKGLPLIYADNAKLKNVGEPRMEADLDTYTGNSGGPVFVKLTTANENEFQYRVIGVVMSGNLDYAVKTGECSGSGCQCWSDRQFKSAPKPPSFYEQISPLFDIGDYTLPPNACVKPKGPDKKDTTRTPVLGQYISVDVKLQSNETPGAYLVKWSSSSGTNIMLQLGETKSLRHFIAAGPYSIYLINLGTRQMRLLKSGTALPSVLGKISATGYSHVSADGTKDFSTIQSAIDAASAGQTIYVYEGHYNENIVITKPGISLIGDGADLSIVHGKNSRPIVIVNMVDNVSISGIQFVNDGNSDTGITVTNSFRSSIKDNTFSGFRFPIFIGTGANNAVIEENSVTGVLTESGVFLHGAVDAIVSSNLIEYSSKNGIDLNAPSTGNVIYLNELNRIAANGIFASNNVCWNIIHDNVFLNVAGQNQIVSSADCNNSISPILYDESFIYHPQEGGIYEPGLWGFSGVRNFHVPRVDDGSAPVPYSSAYLETHGPGGWNNQSEVLSPNFVVPTKRFGKTAVISSGR